MILKIRKIGMKAKFFNFIKNICKELTADITVSGQRLNVLP